MNETLTNIKPLKISGAHGKVSGSRCEPTPEHAAEFNLVPTKKTDSENTALPTHEHSDDGEPVVPEWHPKIKISRHLRAPKLAQVRSHAISRERAYAGVNVQIPGSNFMSFGDVLVFYWGLNKSSTQLLLRTISGKSTVRVLCISYQFVNHRHYGPVDLYYEVLRGPFLIGVSPATRIIVGDDPNPTQDPEVKNPGDQSPGLA